MTSNNDDIDLYTLMNMPFYTEFCNIMYVAGDDKVKITFVKSEFLESSCLVSFHPIIDFRKFKLFLLIQAIWKSRDHEA